ncbi:MAG: hypothetical protein U0821_03865 [Chloroflexota bacterium]
MTRLYGSAPWLADEVAQRRCLFVCGLPGVGKSLLLRHLVELATARNRTAHLLRWDVARGGFETPDVMARYPEVDGVTHAAIRLAVGAWARQAVHAWDVAHVGPRHVLIGELPLVGNRLSELAHRATDGAEPLLAGPGSLFLVPVPTVQVRQAIERARTREMTDPRHEQDAANAPPMLVTSLWDEVNAVAAKLGVPPAEGADYDPRVYTAVYRRVLRHRDVRVAPIESVWDVDDSPHALGAEVCELAPEASAVAKHLGPDGVLNPREMESRVNEWWRG